MGWGAVVAEREVCSVNASEYMSIRILYKAAGVVGHDHDVIQAHTSIIQAFHSEYIVKE